MANSTTTLPWSCPFLSQFLVLNFLFVDVLRRTLSLPKIEQVQGVCKSFIRTWTKYCNQVPICWAALSGTRLKSHSPLLCGQKHIEFPHSDHVVTWFLQVQPVFYLRTVSGSSRLQCHSQRRESAEVNPDCQHFGQQV